MTYVRGNVLNRDWRSDLGTQVRRSFLASLVGLQLRSRSTYNRSELSQITYLRHCLLILYQINCYMIPKAQFLSGWLSEIERRELS